MGTSDELEDLKSKEHNSQISSKYQELLGGLKGNAKEDAPAPVSAPKVTPSSYIDMDRALYHKEGLNPDPFTVPEEFGNRTLAEHQNAYNATMAAMVEAVAQTADKATESTVSMGREQTMLDSPAYREAAHRMVEATAKSYMGYTDTEVETPSYVDPQAVEGDGVRAALRERGEASMTSADMKRMQRLIAFFAFAFLLVLAIIALNSAVLNGMTIEVNGLQGRLVEIQNTISELQEEIKVETDIQGILDYAREAGMMFGL